MMSLSMNEITIRALGVFVTFPVFVLSLPPKAGFERVPSASLFHLHSLVQKGVGGGGGLEVGVGRGGHAGRKAEILSDCEIVSGLGTA